MKKLSLKNSDNLTVDEAFANFKGHCRIKNLFGYITRLFLSDFLTVPYLWQINMPVDLWMNMAPSFSSLS